MNVFSPLRMLRFERGWTQDDVASQIGVRQWIISVLERGERLDGPTFPKVAKLFAQPPNKLRKQMRQWAATASPQEKRVSVRRTA